MNYLPWWLGGLALAAVVTGHWLILGRTIGVSARLGAIVDRARHGKEDDPDMTPEEFVEAMRLATAEAFGTVVPAATETAPTDTRRKPGHPMTVRRHLLFFAGLALGGAISVAVNASLTGHSHPLRGELFQRFFGASPIAMAIVLSFGGVLVGFGTRMAGGCTTGHGLCGVSRIQVGSLAATAAFFGAAVLTSFVLERFLQS